MGPLELKLCIYILVDTLTTITVFFLWKMVRESNVAKICGQKHSLWPDIFAVICNEGVKKKEPYLV
jgi:hypothetical protein